MSAIKSSHSQNCDPLTIFRWRGGIAQAGARKRFKAGRWAGYGLESNLSHDIAIVPESTNMRGRLHHVCFHYISAQHLFDVAELAKEAGIMIEHRPGRHGIGGATFLYMLEPGGNRIEVMGDPGYMIFDPAWRTVVWKGSELDVGATWTGSPLPGSFWSYGTPLAAELPATPQKAAVD